MLLCGERDVCVGGYAMSVGDVKMPTSRAGLRDVCSAVCCAELNLRPSEELSGWNAIRVSL